MTFSASEFFVVVLFVGLFFVFKLLWSLLWDSCLSLISATAAITITPVLQMSVKITCQFDVKFKEKKSQIMLPHTFKWMSVSQLSWKVYGSDMQHYKHYPWESVTEIEHFSLWKEVSQRIYLFSYSLPA